MKKRINEEENYKILKEGIILIKSDDELNEGEVKKLKPIKLIEKIMKMHKTFRFLFFIFLTNIK